MRNSTAKETQDLKVHIPRRTLVKVVGTGGTVAPSVQAMIGGGKPDVKAAPKADNKRDWKSYLAN